MPPDPARLAALLDAVREVLDRADTGYLDRQAKVPEPVLRRLAAALAQLEQAATSAPTERR